MTIHADRILYEDDHLLIVDKLSGELVVKGAGKVGKLPLLDLLKQQYPGLRALNRLDFETSGCVIFAKTKEAYEAGRDTLEKWQKTYHTLVMGQVGRKKGVIRFPLPARNSRTKVEALTRYRTISEFANSSYVEVQIDTGRFHQIRRHFAGIHHPLVLDQEYGHRKFNQVFTQEFGYKRFFLHAAKVQGPHPITGEMVSAEAPLPKPFAALVKRLESLR